MSFLRQSTSQTIRLGKFVDATDGVTAETGLTIANTDILISKDGGGFAAKNSGGATHDSAGWYSATLDATDTATCGILEIDVSVAGALPVFMQFYVVEEVVYDALFAASATGPLTTLGTNAPAAWLNAAAFAAAALPASKFDSANPVPANTTQFGGSNVIMSLDNYPRVDIATISENPAIVSNMQVVFNTDFASNYNTTRNAWVTNAQDFVGTTAADPFNGQIVADSVTNAVTTDSASRTASQADVSGLATSASIAALNDLSAAQVNAEVDTALADYDAPTKAELDAGLAALNDPTAAAIADAVWDETQAGHTTAGTFGLYLDAAVSGVSTGGVSAADIADAVWDEATTGHTTAGTFGEQLKTDVDAILQDTATTIPNQITSLNDLSAAQVNAEVDSAIADAALATAASLAAAQTDLNTITDVGVVATNMRGTDNALLASGYTAPDNATIASIDTKVTTIDGIVDNILVDTGTTIPASIAALNDIDSTAVQSAASAALTGFWTSPASLVDLIYDEATTGHTTAGTYGKVFTDVETDVANVQTGVTTLLSRITSTFAALITNIWSNATRTLTAGTKDSEIDAIKAVTDNLNNLSEAQVNAQVAAALTTYDPPTKAELDAAIGPVAVVTDKLDDTLEDDAGVFRFTINALEQAPAGGGGSGTADWTATEKEQIRHRLRIDGTQTAPADTGYPIVEASRTRAWAFTTTGKTVYAIIYNESDEVYNGTSFESYAAANYATYVRSATETSGTGKYSLSLPEGAYAVEFRIQSGASPSAATDIRIPATKA